MKNPLHHILRYFIGVTMLCGTTLCAQNVTDGPNDTQSMKLQGERCAEEMLKVQRQNTGLKKTALNKSSALNNKPDILFLLSGQSNMAGNGFLPDLPKTSEYEAYRLPLKNVSIWNAKTKEWTLFEITDRFGPEVGFAHTLSKALPDTHIGIVKYARGGTSMDKWHPESKKKLYPRLLADFWDAKNSVPEAPLVAMLWHQGESDSSSKEVAMAYKGKLLQYIAFIRKDTKVPDLLFLCGQVNPGNSFRGRSRWGYVDIVRKAQEEINLANTAVVKTDDCEKNAYIGGEAGTSEEKLIKKNEDNVHYSAKGQIKMGKRFAETYLENAE